MSSIVTDELFNNDGEMCEIIEDVVRSVEEKTILRQRRSLAVKVRLQEMKDRKKKLERIRLDRLASEGIHIDMESIRKTIKDSVKIHDDNIVTENGKTQKHASMGSGNTLDNDVQKNIEEQKRLNKALQDLHNFNKQLYDKDSKQTRRKSISSISSTDLKSNATARRRKSVSHERSESSRGSSTSRTIKRRNSVGTSSEKSRNVKRRNSVGIASEKSKDYKKSLQTIESKELKKTGNKVKNALKLKHS